MTTLMAIAGVLVAAATALVLARIILGPTTHDRLVGLDTVTALIVCGVVIHSAHTGEVDNTTLLVLLVLVGGLSTLTAVRLVPEEDQ